MMNFNPIFQNQIAQAASFFKGQDQMLAEGDDAVEKRRRVGDQFITSKQAILADQGTTRSQMK